MIKIPTVKDKDSESLLSALIDSKRLHNSEYNAFRDMRYKLRNGIGKGGLSPAQREWAERRYAQLDLDADEPSLNLVSSGAVKKDVSTATTIARVLAFVPDQFRKPERPPGRMSR
jgi:hypothetical protein